MSLTRNSENIAVIESMDSADVPRCTAMEPVSTGGEERRGKGEKREGGKKGRKIGKEEEGKKKE